MILSVTVTLAIAIYAYIHRQVRGALYFAWIMLCRSTFACSVMFELQSSSLAGKLLFRNLEQSALAFVAPFVLFFVLDYIGEDRLLKSLRMYSLLLVFGLWTALVWIDPYVHFVRGHVGLRNGELLIDRQPLSVGVQLCGFALVFASLAILGLRLRNQNASFRRQGGWLLLCIAAPTFVELIRTADPQLSSQLLPVSVYSGLLGVGTFWVIFKYRLFSVVPIAADKVMETMQEGMLIVDGSGAVIDSNASMRELLAARSDERQALLGRSAGELLAAWPRWRDACLRMEREELEIESGEGAARRVFKLKVYPLRSERNAMLGTVSILADISESRRQYEQAAELNRIKDQLFLAVSHDIRDPLATLVNLTELLQEEKHRFGEDSAEVLDAMGEQVRNTYDRMENLLEWFRSQRGGITLHPRVWELAGIAEEAIRMLKFQSAAKGIAMSCRIGRELRVLADRDALDLILRNLLSNAVKFTEPGGLVRIEAAEEGGMVIVSVRDNGVGIAPDKVGRLFDQTALGSTAGTDGERGTGLGLFVCSEFVRLGGGRIWVDSVPGEGSSFHFSLPPALS